MFNPPADEQVSVICEQCDGVEGFAIEMFYSFKRQHRLEGRLGTIAFMPKEAYRGLQTADMLAYEGFKHITNQVVKDDNRPVRKLFNTLKAKNQLAIAYVAEPEITTWRAMYKEMKYPAWPPK